MVAALCNQNHTHICIECALEGLGFQSQGDSHHLDLFDPTADALGLEHSLFLHPRSTLCI